MGDGALDALRTFSERGKVIYVHFRDVQGTVPRFQECFVNEGNNSMVDVVKVLIETCFEGFLIADHVPHMVGDTRWGHRGRAYAIGYMTALLEALNSDIPRS
jgi:mannonate dehydratase